jgi:2-keto-4-pentenoate hydratase
MEPQESLIRKFVEEIGQGFRTHELPVDSDIYRLSLPQAYEVQTGFIAERVQEGAHVVGWKVGCTSAAIRRQFRLTQPISGKILAPDVFLSGAHIPASRFMDCAVEPELVFRLGTDIEAGMEDDEILGCLDGVCAGIELHNYRFRNGMPTQQELVASNGIHAGLVLQHMLPLLPLWEMRSEMVSILVNGQVRASGTCAEIMGGPLRSVRWLADHAHERGERLLSGQLVIPGSAVELVRVSANDIIEARFGSLTSCYLTLL